MMESLAIKFNFSYVLKGAHLFPIAFLDSLKLYFLCIDLEL